MTDVIEDENDPDVIPQGKKTEKTPSSTRYGSIRNRV